METIKVGLSKGVTLNLGNYESAKFDCWMEAEVLEKERDTTLDLFSELIDNRLEQEAKVLERSIAKRK